MSWPRLRYSENKAVYVTYVIKRDFCLLNDRIPGNENFIATWLEAYFLFKEVVIQTSFEMNEEFRTLNFLREGLSILTVYG